MNYAFALRLNERYREAQTSLRPLLFAVRS
jgi:hypothetical protein